MDGDGVGYTVKWRGRVPREHSGRQEQNQEGHLRGCQQGASGRPPWGEVRGKGEGCWPAGNPAVESSGVVG